jgi:hypothetical protein
LRRHRHQSLSERNYSPNERYVDDAARHDSKWAEQEGGGQRSNFSLAGVLAR